MDENTCTNDPENVSNKQKSAIQKRPQRRGGKQQLDRPEKVLFCLSLKNPVRSFCMQIVDSKYP